MEGNVSTSVRAEKLNDLYEKCEPIIRSAFLNATSFLFSKQHSSMDISGLEINQNLIKKLKRDIQSVLLHHGLRKGPMDSTARLPFQQNITEDILHAIDNGMSIVQLCNECELGTKYVPVDILEDECLDSRISYTRLSNVTPRAVNAKWERTAFKNIQADKARGVTWEVLWKLGCNPTMHDKGSDVARFDLATMLLTLRNVAMLPLKPNMNNFLFYECAENTLGCKNRRVNYCGDAFACVKSLAEAWNALMLKYYNQPIVGTPAYDKMQSQMFTKGDCAAIIGAISKIYQKDPERTQNMADIFYGCHMPVNRHTNQQLSDLHQPIMSIKTSEQLQAKLDSYKQAREDPMFDLDQRYVETLAVPSGAQAEEEKEVDAVDELIDETTPEILMNEDQMMKLRRAKDFQWEDCRDITIVHKYEAAESQYHRYHKWDASQSRQLEEGRINVGPCAGDGHKGSSRGSSKGKGSSKGSSNGSFKGSSKGASKGAKGQQRQNKYPNSVFKKQSSQ